MLYMQEVEKMEGYGQESYQAKVTFNVKLKEAFEAVE